MARDNEGLQRDGEALKEIQDVANIGGWEYDLRSNRFGMTETAYSILGLPPDVDPTPETVFESYHPDDREMVQQAFDRVITEGTSEDMELRRVTADGDVRWIRARGEPWYDEGELVGGRGTVQEITERKRRETELEQRGRALEELHETTQDLLTATTESEITDCLVNHTLAVFDFDHLGVLRFDGDSGLLRAGATSPGWADESPTSFVVEPGSHPVWNVYQDGETRVLDGRQVPDPLDDMAGQRGAVLVTPIGDYGVVVAVSTDADVFSDRTVELLEVLTANAEAFLGRIAHEQELDDALVRLATQRSRMQELERVVESIRVIQQRATNGGTRDELETAICEELVDIDPIEFVWIGHPDTTDADLSPATWGGSESRYLDSLRLTDPDQTPPSQRAAKQRDTIRISSVSQRVGSDQWAKEALSCGFRSVISVPLLYDDVLYGVLTAYADEAGAFDQMYQQLLTDVGTLLVHYINILEERRFDSANEFLELEFELTDSDYPLHALAAETESKLRFDTVAETTEHAARVLVTVLEGNAEQVRDHASAITRITAAEWFGNPENKQLDVTVRRPFLASEVTKHVAHLVDSVSDGDSTSVFVKVPANVSARPLIESITARYDDIELVARRTETDSGLNDNTDPGDFLTDRQFEILKAAYYGGYFDAPRGVTAQDLAASFDISSPVVYNHLQAAHRTILQRVFDST